MRFDQTAKWYEDHAQVQQQVALWCADWLEHDLNNQNAIEFGAGPGTFTRHIVARGCKNLIASDLSRQMLEVGKQNLPNIKWSREDAWDPSPKTVTRIYSTSLLQWAKDPLHVLRRWRELLVPQGRLLVTLFVEGTLREFSASGPALNALHWQSEPWWLSTVERAGFRVERSSTWKTKRFSPSAVHALRVIHKTGACASHNASATLLRQTLRKYDEQFREPSGVPVSWHALRIEAVKNS